MTELNNNLLRANRAQSNVSERSAELPGASRTTDALAAPSDSSAVEALDPRRRVAIGMMVRGYTAAFVAETLGVARSTVWSWKQEPSFRAALREELDHHVSDIPDAGRDVLRHALMIVQQTMVNGGDLALKASLAVLRSGKAWNAIASAAMTSTKPTSAVDNRPSGGHGSA